MTQETRNGEYGWTAKQKDVTQVVSFQLHDEEYAIEITKVKEIILVAGITRVPQMPDFIEGIINLRGNVIPVLDLRKRFGLPGKALDDQTRIVVTRMDARIVGLIVDSVSQVMKLPNADIQDPPETIAGLAGEYLVGVATVDERLILLLDIERIMNAEERSLLAEAPERVAGVGNEAATPS
ncbi:MAG: chemotaxis protein CheW [Planctomycetota bacterium]